MLVDSFIMVHETIYTWNAFFGKQAKNGQLEIGRQAKSKNSEADQLFQIQTLFDHVQDLPFKPIISAW